MAVWESREAADRFFAQLPAANRGRLGPAGAPELRMQGARQGVQVDDLLPRELWSIATTLDKVLDLTDAFVVTSLGVDPVDLVRRDHVLTQEIGEAAHERGLQGVKSPSATGVDQILVILPENLGVTMLRVELVETWSSVSDLG